MSAQHRTSDPRRWTTPRAGPVSTPTTRPPRAGRPAPPPDSPSDGAPAGSTSRTAGGGRWPTSTTSASGTPGSWCGSGPPSGPGWRRRCCPSLDNLDLALEHAEADPTPIVAGVRAVRDQALAVSSGSATRAATTSASPFDPLRHEVVARRRARTRPGSRRARWSRWCGRATANAERQLRPAAVTVADGRGVTPWRATSTRCSGSVANAEPGRDPAAYRKLARTYHPDVNKDPARRGAVQGDLRGLRRAVRPASTRRRYDRFGDDFRQVPEDWEDRVPAPGPRRGPRGPASGGSRTAGTPGTPTSGDVRYGDFGGGSTSRTCSAACSAAGGRRRRPVAGADQEAELELTVEEAYRGGRRTVTLAGPDGPRTLRRRRSRRA